MPQMTDVEFQSSVRKLWNEKMADAPGRMFLGQADILARLFSLCPEVEATLSTTAPAGTLVVVRAHDPVEDGFPDEEGPPDGCAMA